MNKEVQFSRVAQPHLKNAFDIFLIYLLYTLTLHVSGHYNNLIIKSNL